MTWDALIYLHVVNFPVFCPKPLELDFETVSRFPLRTQNSCLFQQNRNSSQMSAVLPQHWIPRQLYWHAKYSESSPQPCQHGRVTAGLGGVDLQVPFVDTHIWLRTPGAADGNLRRKAKHPDPSHHFYSPKFNLFGAYLRQGRGNSLVCPRCLLELQGA